MIDILIQLLDDGTVIVPESPINGLQEWERRHCKTVVLTLQDTALAAGSDEPHIVSFPVK